MVLAFHPELIKSRSGRMASSITVVDQIRGGFGDFLVRPLPGRRRPPPPCSTDNLLMATRQRDGQKKSPTTTLNKRSLWESLFRPRTRPSKCAIPYFIAPNSFGCCFKLMPTQQNRCTQRFAPCAAMACCIRPITRESPRRVPKKFFGTFNRAGAFAAACAASAQRPCPCAFWAGVSTSLWPWCCCPKDAPP